MPTIKELEAQVAALTAANANLVAAQPKPRAITVKLSDTTGAIVVSGLSGRFPTTLYRSSWRKLFTKEIAALVLDFIEEHDAAITAAMTKAGKTDH